MSSTTAAPRPRWVSTRGRPLSFTCWIMAEAFARKSETGWMSASRSRATLAMTTSWYRRAYHQMYVYARTAATAAVRRWVATSDPSSPSHDVAGPGDQLERGGEEVPQLQLARIAPARSARTGPTPPRTAHAGWALVQRVQVQLRTSERAQRGTMFVSCNLALD